MAQHPFRFSVNVYGAKSREAWVTKAQKVEALGYDCFFVADHLITFPPVVAQSRRMVYADDVSVLL